MADEQTEQTQTTEEEKTTTEQTQQTQETKEEKPDFKAIAKEAFQEVLGEQQTTTTTTTEEEEEETTDDPEKAQKRKERELAAREAKLEVLEKYPDLMKNPATKDILDDMVKKARPANEIKEMAKKLNTAYNAAPKVDMEKTVTEVAAILEKKYDEAYGKPGAGAGNAVNRVDQIKKITNIKDLVKDAEAHNLSG